MDKGIAIVIIFIYIYIYIYIYFMIASFIQKKNEVLLDYCTIFLKKAVNRLFTI